LKFSIFEINDNKIYDVLNGHKELYFRNKHIVDNKEIEIEKMSTLNTWINKAKNKKNGPYSHIILHLNLTMKYFNDECQFCSANFVELGSMCGHGNIDGSFLHALEQLSLGNTHNKYVESSKLVDLLNEPIGGNCKTAAFFITTNPQSIPKEYAQISQNLKKIKNQPKQNNEIPNEILQKINKEHEIKINQLVNELRNLKQNVVSNVEIKQDDDEPIEKKNVKVNELKQDHENELLTQEYEQMKHQIDERKNNHETENKLKDDICQLKEEKEKWKEKYKTLNQEFHTEQSKWEKEYDELDKKK